MNGENIKPLPIKRTNPDGLRPIFVNDVVITHTKDAFFITLSQIEVPAILSSDESDEISSVNAIAVSKFVISAEFAKVFIDALSTNYEKYLKNVEQESKDE
jgi:hypothetical protein